MTIDWTREASRDLVRLAEFLASVAPDVQARVVIELVQAASLLADSPRLGLRLPAYEPREVRRLVVGNYEMRYEVTPKTVYILRIWHGREER